ncbi:MAG: carbohydrate kinase family protein [Ignavibacteriales bacterium]|nr:carbohydrate kinase family protein [Ignavibacteriales bacterium]
MKITVIGHLCLDTIHLPGARSGEGGERELGGIIFAVGTLANLAGPDDLIIPVFGVGTSDHERLQAWVSKYPQVDPSGIFLLDGPTNEVHLFYEDNGTARTECSAHLSQPIPFERIKPHLNTDAVLINMISGFDITIETLDRIRMEVRDRGTPIHFDFHSLTLGVDPQSRRFRRALPDWRRWCFMLHSIQVSEEESSGLSAERYDEATFINQLMPLMVHTLIITRGARGATVVQQMHKKLTRREIPGIETSEFLDPTGCGDVFGAAYVFKYLQTHDSFKAAEFANRIAAFNSTRSGTQALDHLPQFIKTLEIEQA